MATVSFPAAGAGPSPIGFDDPVAAGNPSDPGDPAATATEVTGSPSMLTDAQIEVARAAAVEEAGAAELVGEYLGASTEDDVAVSAAFSAADRGYRGWYWSVTVAVVGQESPTVSEVVLLPGDQALLAPPWVPWDQRIRPGDVGAGDLLQTAPDDSRLVPGYVDSDDPAVKEVAYEFGFGRSRVLSREGRDDAAQRWHDGPFGPDDPIATQAQANCVTCGFFVPLAGLLGMALGACSNEYSPADGRVVDAEYGCGAHSDTVIDAPLISASTDTVVDEFTLEVHRRPERVGAVVDGAVVDGAVVDGAVVGAVVDQAVVDQAVVDEAALDEAVVDVAWVAEDVVDDAVVDWAMVDVFRVEPEPENAEPAVDQPDVTS